MMMTTGIPAGYPSPGQFRGRPATRLSGHQRAAQEPKSPGQCQADPGRLCPQRRHQRGDSIVPGLTTPIARLATTTDRDRDPTPVRTLLLPALSSSRRRGPPPGRRDRSGRGCRQPPAGPDIVDGPDLALSGGFALPAKVVYWVATLEDGHLPPLLAGRYDRLMLQSVVSAGYIGWILSSLLFLLKRFSGIPAVTRSQRSLPVRCPSIHRSIHPSNPIGRSDCCSSHWQD